MEKINAITPSVLTYVEELYNKYNSRDLILIFDMGRGRSNITQHFEHDPHPYLVVEPGITSDEVAQLKPKCIIISDGPGSPYNKDRDKRPNFDRYILDLQIPTLGIGLGCEIITDFLNKPEPTRYDWANCPKAEIIKVDVKSDLFHGCMPNSQVIEYGAYSIPKQPFVLEIAWTSVGTIALECNHLFGIYFDPFSNENQETCGDILISNFIYRIALGHKGNLLASIPEEKRLAPAA